MSNEEIKQLLEMSLDDLRSVALANGFDVPEDASKESIIAALSALGEDPSTDNDPKDAESEAQEYSDDDVLNHMYEVGGPVPLSALFSKFGCTMQSMDAMCKDGFVKKSKFRGVWRYEAI